MSEGELTTTTVKTHNKGQSDAQRLEERFPVTGLVTTDETQASVTQSVSTKVSDSLYYGKGTWDKIPYTVEVFSSVKLHCDQSEEKILAAQNMAHQLAFEAARERMAHAVMSHVENMRDNLYRSMFHED